MMTRSSPGPKTGVAGWHLVGLVAGMAAGAASGALIGNAAVGPLGAVVGGVLCAMLGALLGHTAAEAIWPTMDDLYSMRTPSRIESRGSGRVPGTPATASGNPFAPPPMETTAATTTRLAPSDPRLPARSRYSKETR